MKKIISIVLSLALVFGICCVSTSAAQVDITTSSTAQLFYSNEPFEEISPVNGRVIGYIGDTDNDGQISIMDATAIQMHIAQLTTLSDDAILISDVDFDEDITIIDTTEIQLYIAQLSENPYITHTLYEDDYIEYTFDQIADHLMQYGDFYADNECYCVEISTSEIEGADYTLVLAYYPGEECIDFFAQYYDIENALYFDTFMNVTRNNPVFWFGNSIFSRDDIEATYYADYFGTSELVDDVNIGFSTKCTSFESSVFSDFSEVQEVCESQFKLALAVANDYLWDYIDGYVYDIFW